MAALVCSIGQIQTHWAPFTIFSLDLVWEFASKLIRHEDTNPQDPMAGQCRRTQLSGCPILFESDLCRLCREGICPEAATGSHLKLQGEGHLPSIRIIASWS